MPRLFWPTCGACTACRTGGRRAPAGSDCRLFGSVFGVAGLGEAVRPATLRGDAGVDADLEPWGRIPPRRCGFDEGVSAMPTASSWTRAWKNTAWRTKKGPVTWAFAWCAARDSNPEPAD